MFSFRAYPKTNLGNRLILTLPGGARRGGKRGAMKFFLDTANLNEIREGAAHG